MTLLKGAVPRSDTAQKSDELNHPRACSTASRYASAGHFSSGRALSTAACDEPESNHTSRMSSSLTKTVPPHFAHLTAGIGTPHARWREIHQSGRVSVMLRIRSRDHAGYHFTLSIASITLPRSP